MNDTDEFLHDIDRLIFLLKELERAKIDEIGRDKFYDKVIVYQENLEYFIKQWAPKKNPSEEGSKV